MKVITLFSIIAGGMLLQACTCVQQWQEAREMDAKYNAYVERCQTEDPELTSLKKAAATAARAQIRVVWDTDKEDTLIALGAEELAAIREMMPRMKETPALCREAWEKQQRQYPMLVSYRGFGYLEFLNDQGETIAELALEVMQIGTCEKAEEYTRDYRFSRPAYMLPAADLTRFKFLPAMVKYEQL